MFQLFFGRRGAVPIALLLIVFCSAWFSSHTFAQSTLSLMERWEFRNRDPHSASFQEVQMLTDSIWFFQHRKQQMVITFDAGKTFTYRTTPAVEAWDLYFHDTQRGYLLGDGKIFFTRDGGATWSLSFEHEGAADFFGIAFRDSLVGVAGGYSGEDSTVLARTIDGGKSWSLISHPRMKWSIGQIQFAGGDTVYAMGGEGILKSVDAGLTWNLILTRQSSGAFSGIHELQFLDGFFGWLGGKQDTLLRTEDGGETWAKVPFGCETCRTSRTNILALHFHNRDTGWVATSFPATVWRTFDGGNTWTRLELGALSASWFQTVAFNSRGTGVLLANSVLFMSEDWGTTWANRVQGILHHWYSLTFADPDTGWIVGSRGGIARSVDGGNNWTAQTSGTQSALNSVAAIDSRTGFAVGAGGLVLRTTTGGQVWETLTLETEQTLNAVHAFNALHLLVVGDSGLVARSVDAGATWIRQTISNRNLKDVAFRGGLGIAVGDTGSVYTSSDSGKTWSAKESGVLFPLFKISLVNKTVAYAAGESDIVLKTVDAGESWQQQPVTGVQYQIGALTFIDTSTGWLWADFQAKPFRTVDGGATWTPAPPAHIDGMINAGIFFGPNRAIIVGNSGVVLTYRNDDTPAREAFSRDLFAQFATAPTLHSLLQSSRSLALFDSRGRLVWKSGEAQRLAFPQHVLSMLKPGMYFYSASGKDGQVRTGRLSWMSRR